MKKITLLLMLIFVLGCRTTDLIAQGRNNVPVAVEKADPTVRPTFTPKPPTSTPTPLPTNTRTRTRPPTTARPTATRTLTPLPTQILPTVSPWEFVFDKDAIVKNPNCDMFFEGRVVDKDGNGIRGVIVEARWFDNVDFNVTGQNRSEDAFDKWGFAPLSHNFGHVSVPFEFRVVSSKGNNRRALSETLKIVKPDCNVVGQFTNIIIRKTR